MKIKWIFMHTFTMYACFFMIVLLGLMSIIYGNDFREHLIENIADDIDTTRSYYFIMALLFVFGYGQRESRNVMLLEEQLRKCRRRKVKQ